MADERYQIGNRQNGRAIAVIDNEDGRVVSSHEFWSQALSAAAALNRAAAAAEHVNRHLMPVAPCCDCREQVVKCEAIIQIARAYCNSRNSMGQLDRSLLHALEDALARLEGDHDVV